MIFADTSYFLALLSPRDQWHAEALRQSRELRETLVTTEWVLVELANAMCEPTHRRRCVAFVRSLRRTDLQTVPATSTGLERGLALYEDRPDKDWSLTDCISFCVMTEHGLTDALTTDRHFEQAGFRALMRPAG